MIMAFSDINTMTLSGGVCCLDFVNTGLETNTIPVERLHSYEDILTLVERLSIMKPADLLNLKDRAKANPSLAESSLKRGIILRKVLSKIFSNIVGQNIKEINQKDLAQLNTWRLDALGGQGLAPHGDLMRLEWIESGDSLMQPFWVFTISAVELLQNHTLKYVKRCAGCDWFFYDQSKSHRRKWCDMQTCGSSAKGRRYYQRKKTNTQI